MLQLPVVSNMAGLLIVLWLVSLVVSNGLLMMIGTQINDDVERSLPVKDRPSWQLLTFSRWPTPLLRRHREMYPASRLRTWWTIAAVCQGAVVLSPFIAAFWRSA